MIEALGPLSSVLGRLWAHAVRRWRRQEFVAMPACLARLHKSGFRPRAILDVGAQYTNWTRLAATYFPTSQFHLIEPLQEMQSHLEEFCRAYPGSRYYAVAAGAQNDCKPCTVFGGLASAQLLTPPNPALQAKGQQRDVEVVTVDSLVQGGMPVPDLVKLDVQGYELEVLKGASRLMGVTEAFILEVSTFRYQAGQPVFHEVIAYMAERGYLLYDLAGFLLRPKDGVLGQIDLCFAKEKGYLRQSDAWS